MPPDLATDTGGTPTNAADGKPADAAISAPADSEKKQDGDADLDRPKNSGHVTFAPIKPVNATVAPKIKPAAATYSGAVSNSLPKSRDERTRAENSQLRAMAFEKNWTEQQNGAPVLFSHHPDDFLIGIPFDVSKTNIVEVAEAIEEAYPSPIATATYYLSNCAYVSFPSAEARDKALSAPLTLQKGELPVSRVIRSIGTRITISSDYIPIGDIQARHSLLQELFKDFGKIIHFSSLCNTKSKLNRAPTRFVLEVRPDAPQDLMIPRVAAVKGCNVLFAWSGSHFCFRCGKGDHLKAQCPKPHNYILHEQAALSEPILGRAFPDPDAPLRPLRPIGKQAPVPVAQASGKNGQQGRSNAPSPPGKRKHSGPSSRAPSDTTVVASDSDSGEKPVHKKGPGHLPKESNIVRTSVPTGRENSRRVADSTISSASPPLGPHPAGATSVPRTDAPSSKVLVDATGTTDGQAPVTPTPSTLATEEKLSGSAGIKTGKKLTAGNPLAAPSVTVSVSDSPLGDKPTQLGGPGHPSKESKIVLATDPTGRENQISVADISPLSATLSLGQQSAGASVSGANTPVSAAPPSKSSADTVGASDGSARSTTSLPVPGAAEKVTGSSEPGTPQTPTDPLTQTSVDVDMDNYPDEAEATLEDMDGIELTTEELMELDDPHISQERRSELQARKHRGTEIRAKLAGRAARRAKNNPTARPTGRTSRKTAASMM